MNYSPKNRLHCRHIGMSLCGRIIFKNYICQFIICQELHVKEANIGYWKLDEIIKRSMHLKLSISRIELWSVSVFRSISRLFG